MVAEDGRELHHVFPLLSFEFVRRVYWVHGNACLAAGKSLCLGGGWIGGRVVTVVVRRRWWGLGVDRTSVHRTGIDGTIFRRTGVDSSGIRETSNGSAIVPGATGGIHGMGIGSSVVPETAVDGASVYGTIGGLSSWACPILLLLLVARSHRSRLSLGCDLSLWLLKIFIVLD